MKTFTLTLILIAITLTSINAQSNNEESTYRKGFVIGTAVGGGMLLMNNEGESTETYGRYSLPNLKIGWMVNPDLAAVIHIPGGTHQLNTESRAFEAIVPSLQYWIKDRYWIMGGVGLAMDMTPFYKFGVYDPDFYFGTAVTVSTGYEIYKKKNFALDIQARVLYGNYDVEDVNRQCTAFDIVFGFNWY